MAGGFRHDRMWSLIFALMLTSFKIWIAQDLPKDPRTLFVDKMKPRVDDKVQEKEAMALIRRLLPQQSESELFSIEVNATLCAEDEGRIEMVAGQGRVHIKATSGVMATWTFYEYLRQFAKIQVSWEYRQLKLPSPLPLTNNFTLKPPDLFRYYQNPCLYGYTFPFWKWQPDWSDHLDWMALNGINLAMALSGQEMIWLKTYQTFGLTPSTIQGEFFTGKAFLPWNRMGNIKGWAGPLSSLNMKEDVKLQHQILDRMAKLGITPAIPAFNGIVPSQLQDLFPNEIFYPLRNWGHFEASNYSGLSALMPDSELFARIQKTFKKFYDKEYGIITNFYAFDTFNEMSPPSNETSFLTKYGQSISGRIKDMDPNGVWLMQGWMFTNETYWTVERSKALLEAIPPQQLLILDLASTTNPQYSRLESFYGRPFIYCMLHNYGGTLGLYGKATVVNNESYKVRGHPDILVCNSQNYFFKPLL
jgi:alpha-N-acetylglucosaminidase